nr:MAG: coat protein [Sanya fiers-like virus 26]
MPQLANLVLTDRAATPVNHTFTPRDIVNNVATVEEATGGVPIGFNRVTVGLVRTQSGRYKATLKGSFPIVQTQTINGVSSPVVVRTGYFDLTLSFDATSSEQERKDVVGMLASALDPSKTLVNDVVTKLQSVY